MEFFRNTVQRQLDAGQWTGNELSPAGRRAVAKQISSRYPGRPAVAKIPGLLVLNANTVAVKLMNSP